MKIQDERNILNQEALDNPKPGDYWNEMFCPYFVVVAVNGPDITVLSCLGGPDSYSRKHEVPAKITHKDGSWSFDYDKSMVVDRKWMEKAVKYDSIDGFIADVRRPEKMQLIVEEWIEHRTKKLMKELKQLGPHVSKYMLSQEW
jgi:hypothetical protein